MGALNDEEPRAPKDAGERITEAARARAYGDALDMLFDATCVIDPELIVLECDAGFARLMGKDAGDLVGAPLPALELTGSLEGQPITLRHVAALGRWRGHATLSRPEGETLSLDTLLVHDSGAPRRMHLFLRDLSGPLSLQVGDVDHKHALTQVSRLSALGEMASGIAHEINQPLAAIVNYANGCVSLIQQERAEDEVLTKALRSIAEQSERAAQIIRKMRAFARRPDGQRGTFHLTDLLRDALQVSASQRRRVGIELRCDFQADPDAIVADGIQIEQVILHLVRNAVDSLSELPSEHPRIIDVTTEDSVDEATGHPMIATTVTDSGGPMAGDVEVRLFAPFHTTRRNGLGLGLVISRTIIESHSGRLTYLGNADAPLSGPSFRFTLPTRPAPITL